MKNFISIMFLQNIKNIEGEENVEIVDFSTVKIRTSGGFRFVSVNADGLVTSDQDEEVRTEYTYDDHNKKTMIKKICNIKYIEVIVKLRESGKAIGII